VCLCLGLGGLHQQVVQGASLGRECAQRGLEHFAEEFRARFKRVLTIRGQAVLDGAARSVKSFDESSLETLTRAWAEWGLKESG
jgi:hypothetical protein